MIDLVIDNCTPYWSREGDTVGEIPYQVSWKTSFPVFHTPSFSHPLVIFRDKVKTMFRDISFGMNRSSQNGGLRETLRYL